MKLIHTTLSLIIIFFSHTTITMDKVFDDACAEYEIIATISEKINRLCGNVDLQELNSDDMIEIIDCINQCYPGIIITRDLIDDLCVQNSFFAYTIKYHVVSAVQNYNHVTCDTLPIVTNQQEQQPVRLLNKLPQPIKEHVMFGAQHQSDLRITQEKCDNFYLLNTAINNTFRTITANELFKSPGYTTLQLDQRYALQEKLVKKNIAVKKAQLEINQICANKDLLRTDLEYNFDI